MEMPEEASLKVGGAEKTKCLHFRMKEIIS
jgi:hypothetical protein